MNNRLFIILFCFVLALPGVMQLTVDVAAKRWPFAEVVARDFRIDSQHLAALEKRIEEEWVGTPWVREIVQSFQLGVLSEGNSKVLVAKNGWLVYRPGLAAMLGPGPFGGDVKTVAKPPPAVPWLPVIDAITDFAQQLNARGIELILIPVPDKVSVHPEILGGRSSLAPLRHPDMRDFEARVQKAGVKIVPLAEEMARHLQSHGAPLFMKTDTHWNRRGLEVAVNETLQLLQGVAPKVLSTVNPQERKGRGDLGVMLSNLSQRFAEESAGVWEQPLNDAAAPPIPVLVIGDSFVNVFRDAKLGFGEGGGFAELLKSHLGDSIDVIAINGGGATQVRQELARRSELLEGKRAVVWVIAERDFCPARASDRVESSVWRKVQLPNAAERATREVEGLTVDATIESVSAFPDPGEAPYRDCLGVLIYRVDAVVAGEWKEATLPVVQWIFRDEKLLPPSEFRPGMKQRLKLAPFTKQPAEIQNVQRVDDSRDIRALWWAVESTPLE